MAVDAKKGCTYTALSEIAQTLEKQGIQAEIIHAVPETEIIKSVARKSKNCRWFSSRFSCILGISIWGNHFFLWIDYLA